MTLRVLPGHEELTVRVVDDDEVVATLDLWPHEQSPKRTRIDTVLRYEDGQYDIRTGVPGQPSVDLPPGLRRRVIAYLYVEPEVELIERRHIRKVDA